jgi:UDP-N-acetylmuramate dehydrogenase
MMPALPSQFRSSVRLEEPMSRHTSWHVGGPAQIYFTPTSRAELAAFLASLPREVPVYWIGLGSNLLVRDGGIDGVVISTHGTLDRLERIGDDVVLAEAGVACARIARQCVKWGFDSGEFFAGIPGTLGGALAMNAGAFGGETWRHVLEVDTVDRGGRGHTRGASEYQVAYRCVEPPAPQEWFVAARLRFSLRERTGDPAASVPPEEPIRRLLARRKATQPIGEWSCGSVFTNPPGDHAARLIEAAGLKGLAVGGASVSAKHANFIINHGSASAADIERLIARVQEEVYRSQGVRLQTEVRIVGREA